MPSHDDRGRAVAGSFLKVIKFQDDIDRQVADVRVRIAIGRLSQRLYSVLRQQEPPVPLLARLLNDSPTPSETRARIQPDLGT